MGSDDKQALEEIRSIFETHKSDPESLHVEVEDKMITLLEESGYESTAAYIREIREHFWYA